MRNPFILTIGLSLIVLLYSGWISYRTLVAALASDNENRHSRNKNELVAKTSSSSSPPPHQLTSTKTRRKSRHKRDIWQLYGVIRCKTPCDPFILKNYGCYCGLGGTGSPMDDVDRCCMLHDYCYHNTPCHQALTYFLPYNWKCIAGRPHCSIPPRWTPIYACSLHLCECDRLFSECLHDYGCPKDKTICGTDQYRRVWQKFLIRLGIG